MLGVIAVKTEPQLETVMSKKSSVQRTRRVFDVEFNAKVALAALRDNKTGYSPPYLLPAISGRFVRP